MSASGEHSEREQPVFVVALTGGIASGKTTVSDLFRELGVAVIDTDVIARELVEPGQPKTEFVTIIQGSRWLSGPCRGVERFLCLQICLNKFEWE